MLCICKYPASEIFLMQYIYVNALAHCMDIDECIECPFND